MMTRICMPLSGRLDMVQRVGDVLRPELAPVMELDTLAENQLERGGAGPGPALGQQRLVFVRDRIAVEERVALRIGDDQHLALVAIVEIRRADLGAGRPNEGVVGLARKRRAASGEECGRADREMPDGLADHGVSPVCRGHDWAPKSARAA
jgi:hypothetical protein